MLALPAFLAFSSPSLSASIIKQKVDINSATTLLQPMSIAASLPAEVLLVVFEHLFFTKDLLCVVLANRAWRAACISLQKLWRRHWQFIKISDVQRRRILAKDPSSVDWYAESA